MLATAAGLGGAALATTVTAAGEGLRVKEGANATMGTLTLNGATPAGIAYVSARTAGTSFSVKGVAGDTSTVAWLIVEPG
jgi:hypothetical protein